MATCLTCSGRGGRDGDFESCYRCGGSGHGSDTRIACASCHGSGRGTTRRWETCWHCHGSGTVPDPPQQKAAAPKSRQQSESKPQRQATKGRASAQPSGQKSSKANAPWTRWNTLFFVLGTRTAFGYLKQHTDMEGGLLLLVACVPGAIIGRFWKPLLGLGVAGTAVYLFFSR